MGATIKYNANGSAVYVSYDSDIIQHSTTAKLTVYIPDKWLGACVKLNMLRADKIKPLSFYLDFVSTDDTTHLTKYEKTLTAFHVGMYGELSVGIDIYYPASTSATVYTDANGNEYTIEELATALSNGTISALDIAAFTLENFELNSTQNVKLIVKESESQNPYDAPTDEGSYNASVVSLTSKINSLIDKMTAQPYKKICDTLHAYNEYAQGEPNALYKVGDMIEIIEVSQPDLYIIAVNDTKDTTTYTDEEIEEAVATPSGLSSGWYVVTRTKIDTLTASVDDYPTAGSTNFVKSGGVYSAINTTVDTTSTSPITLTDQTSFRLGTITTLTINTASTYPLNFECEVVFTAGSTIAIDYSALTLTWSGDDVASNMFTPQANKTYNILFFNNATATATPNLQAIVRGV